MMEIRKEAPSRRDWEQTVADYRNRFLLSNGELPLEHYRYRGVVLVWTVLVVLALVLMVGLSLDIAKLCLVNNQLHIAADAAALAGGPWVKKDAQNDFLISRELARDIAAANIADHVAVDLDLNLDNLPDGDIIVGNYTYLSPEQTGEEQGRYVFIPYDPDNPIPVNALAVIASRDVDEREGHLATQRITLNFGPMAGVDAVDISGNWQGEPPGLRGPYAIALTGGGTGAGLICLRHDGTGLHAQGEGKIIVNNLTGDDQQGAIQVNSDDDEVSVTLNGTPDIVVDYMTITAKDFSQVGNFDLYENTTVLLGQPRMPDPLYWLNHTELKPTEYIGTANDLGTIVVQNDNDPVLDTIIQPGYYSGGLTFKGGTVDKPVRLASGIYILDGAGLQVLAGSYVIVDPTDGDADGDGIGEAFFYIASGDWEASGTCCLVQGNAVLRADPLTTEPYAGIMFAQDDQNLNDAYITGTGDTLIDGTLYFPQERPAEEQNKGNGKGFSLRLGGTGLGTGNQIITSSLYCFGTGDKIINYLGDNPSPVTDAWLVE